MHSRMRALLSAWYHQDRNDLSGCFVLRKREGIYAEDSQTFEEASEELKKALG